MQGNIEKEFLVRAAVEVVHGAIEPLKIWLPMLFPSGGGLIVEDVQSAFPILYCCVRDLARAQSSLNTKAMEAKSAGFEFLERNIVEISLQCSYAGRFLECYSTDEQIYLSLLRDRMVHGFLEGSTRSKRGIWVTESRGLKNKPFTKDRLLEAIRNVKGEKISDANAVLHLFLSRRAEIVRYLSDVEELFVDADLLYDALMKDHVVVFDKLSIYAKAGRGTQ